MNIKKFLNFERNIQIDFPFSYREFEKEFKRRYEQDKNSEFKGELDYHKFKLWVAKGFFNTVDFSELNGIIEDFENENIIKAKVELSDTITTMFLLSLIISPIFIIYELLMNFNFKFILVLFIFVFGFIITINFQLNNEKNTYIEEIKSLIRYLKNNKKSC
jgi:hypothetical protein